jgi:hypothetical protein
MAVLTSQARKRSRTNLRSSVPNEQRIREQSRRGHELGPTAAAHQPLASAAAQHQSLASAAARTSASVLTSEHEARRRPDPT